MGELVTQTIQRLNDSSELRFNAGIKSMDDTRVNTIVDALTRTELEFAGIESDDFSMDEIVNGGIVAKGDFSMDDLSRFTDRQLEDFDRTIRETEYGDVDIRKNLQTSMVPVGATKHTFFAIDKKGKYKTITGSSRDLPASSISGSEDSINIIMGGGSLEWNQQEMDAANFAGVPLEMEKVKAVKRAYLEYIYDLTINGDNNVKGLMTSDIDEAQVADTIENPNTVAGAALKYWVNKTGREIVNDLTDARVAISTGTQGRWGGPVNLANLEGSTATFTCLLPLASYHVLLDSFMHTSAGGTNQTVWNYLNSVDGQLATAITNYAVVLDFDSAFNSGTDAGFMLLPNDVNAYSIASAKEITANPVQFQMLSMVIPYYNYFGGLKLIRNKALIRRRSIQAP